MVWSKKNKDSLTSTTNPVGGGIRGNKRLTHTNHLTLLTTLKHLSILSITTSLLLVLTINIYRTYSYTNTLASAVEDSSLATETDAVCDPNNTSAPACIGLSVTSSAQSGGSPTATTNLTMKIPRDGGIVTGYQTIELVTNSDDDYKVTITTDSSSNDLVRYTGDDQKDLANVITSLPIAENLNNDFASVKGTSTLSEDNTWGVAIPGLIRAVTNSKPGASFWRQDFPFGTPDVDYQTTDPVEQAALLFAGIPPLGDNSLTLTHSDIGRNSETDIYYGVRVDDPGVTTRPGEYKTNIIYTVTLVPDYAVIKSVTPNVYNIGSDDSPTITITGTNLATAYEVWVDMNEDKQYDQNEACTDIQIIDDTKLTCTIPTAGISLYQQVKTYKIYVRTQAINVSTGANNSLTYQRPSICRNADPYSDCQVDIDNNMIPIYYDGNTENGEAIWKVANPNDPGSWYDYTNKQWANAVTVTKEALDANKYQNPGTVIDNNDVLGYWVYIPRYAYEVQRPNAVDRVVAPQNFNIRFETTEDVKKTPKESCNLGIKTATDMWSNGTPNNVESNIKAKDYRTECGISRIFPNSYVVLPGVDIATLAVSNSTWATHPAFIWGTGKTLNGFWIGKFETTGSVINPTVMPNSKHIGDMNTTELGNIGGYYTIAKHIGSYDSNNTGGNDVSLDGQIVSATGPWDSTHNLQNATSHMLKNSEWGAVAYLASSNYGAGIDESGNSRVFNNAQLQYGLDGNNQASYGVTGCGPVNTDNPNDQGNYGNGTASSPGTGGAIGTSEACLSGHPEKSYSGSVGVMASTTNNVYGVYDMAGGAYEYVMGNLTGNEDQIEIQDVTFFKNTTSPPYVDLYNESPNGNFTSSASSNPISWSLSPSENMWNNDVCTWSTCGGQALHETKMYQSVSGDGQSWGSDGSNFVHSNVRWFLRGDNSQYGSVAGIFGTIGSDGYTNSGYSFRSALVLTN